MRPNQNRRMRGRNRPKGPNPLTRSYESNGPDVKIRGTAQHIADKYAQLARDALASGDPVAAENYFQHGEHYFRIITCAQEPNRTQAAQGYARQAFEDEDEGDEDGLQGETNGAGENGERENNRRGDEYGDLGQQPQPYERHDFESRQNRNERQERRDDRRDRFQNRNDRPQRFDTQRQDYGRGDYRQDQSRRDQPRQDYGRQDRPRQDYGRQDQDHPRQDVPRQDYGRPDQGREQPRYENGRDGEARRDRRRDEARASEEAPGLPAFLMTATRNPVSAEPEAPRAAEREPKEAPAAAAGQAEEASALKPKRRRARYKAPENAEAAPPASEPAEASSGE